MLPIFGEFRSTNGEYLDWNLNLPLAIRHSPPRFLEVVERSSPKLYHTLRAYMTLVNTGPKLGPLTIISRAAILADSNFVTCYQLKLTVQSATPPLHAARIW